MSVTDGTLRFCPIWFATGLSCHCYNLRVLWTMARDNILNSRLQNISFICYGNTQYILWSTSPLMQKHYARRGKKTDFSVLFLFSPPTSEKKREVFYPISKIYIKNMSGKKKKADLNFCFFFHL